MVSFRCSAALATTGLFSLQLLASPVVLAGKGDPSAGRMNCGAQIECLTPEGHPGRIARLPLRDPKATALIMEDDTVTCALREGETNFVIELPGVAVPDRFIFLNENGKAQGELKISVSNRRLAADSPRWKEVEGVIPFSHKRLFGVSLLGIQAKYVRLSFRVEKSAPATGSKEADPGVDLTKNSPATRSTIAFATTALSEALNSTIAPATIAKPIGAGPIFSSVAPLRLTSN